jgi:mxaA protein
MRPLVLLAVLAAATATGATARMAQVAVSEPRAFGYFLGDVMRRDVELTMEAGARLEIATLPRPGPINYWLELRSVDTDERSVADGTRVHISLEYQAFYAALDPHRLTIPGFTLKISGQGGSEEAQIPAWSFVMSPLRELFPGKENEAPAVAMQPDARPPLLATGLERSALLAAAIAALASLVLLARHLAWWPFHRRPSRPFTEAARFLQANTAQLTGEGGYRAALIKLHRAFDLAAGRRVLPDDLEAFLKDHPEFAPHSADIERLFACSRAAFFANDNARARAAMPFEAIADLGSRLGAAERRAG